MRTAAEVKDFALKWRERILARRANRSELLSEEEFGQLVTLNTIVDFVNDTRVGVRPPT